MDWVWLCWAGSCLAGLSCARIGWLVLEGFGARLGRASLDDYDGLHGVGLRWIASGVVVWWGGWLAGLLVWLAGRLRTCRVLLGPGLWPLAEGEK